MPTLFLLILLWSLGWGSLAWSGSATLTWTAPTTNADGTPLTDLAGYVVSSGTTSGTYDTVRDAGTVTTLTIYDLTEGQTYYFVVQAYDASKNLSDRSREMSKTIPTTVEPPTTVDPPTTVLRRMTAGSRAYTDARGQRWDADRAYTPGSWGYVGGKAYTSKKPIQGTEADPIYQSERYGKTFTYQFDVPNGLYQVTLHDAEIVHKVAGRRVFDVLAEGQIVLKGIDLYAIAGLNRAIWWTFPVPVTDGQLTLEWRTTKDNAKVSAIEIESR